MIERRALLQSLAALPLAGQTQSAPRPWIGAEYWSNPLQDWQARGERIECIAAGGDRNVYLLTYDLSRDNEPFETSVRLGRLEEERGPLGPGWIGLRVGIRGAFDDYRDSALRGRGLDCGISTDGRLFIGEVREDAPRVSDLADVTLRLSTEPRGAQYRLTLASGKLRLTRDVPAEWLVGGLALVCSSGEILPSPQPVAFPTDPAGGLKPGTQRGGNVRFWFRNWRVGGAKLAIHQERAWGPILFTQYTLSRGTMKLTAQLAPSSGTAAELHVRRGGVWQKIADATVDADSCTARFRISGWDASVDVPYRVVYETQSYEGVIRRDPLDKPRIVVGALTCQNDHGFPHAPIARNLKAIDPDILFFTGDQLYERSGEYGIQRAPAAMARLDYLRKWFLFGWAWGDLTRNTPCVCLPDDHDVYHGNVWGAGGRKAEGAGPAGQDSGGYVMPAEWVNIVERTQSSHLPDPPDATPVDQGIAVHYGHLVWGGVSFALLEDRKWKSAPKTLLANAQIYNGWPQNAAYGAKDGDVAGAQLLGPRQEKFLDEWSRDWTGGIWMKCAVSATIFCNVATLPASAKDDSIVPKLAPLEPGAYPADDKTVMDHDSNGWPQTPRNRALRSLARCLAVHVAGDQHLASTVQYGVDEHGDAPWAICTPAISNIFPRRWYPPSKQPFGKHLDGFGNRITVHAVANPLNYRVEPAALNNRAPGFGVVEFDRDTRRITLANWPRWADVTKGGRPYPGWPVTIDQASNGMSAAPFVLDPLTSREPDPVVEVLEESTGAIVRCWRASGTRIAVRVWRQGRYTVRLFNPDGKFEVIRRGLVARKA
ncbi:MAG: alkaline phosphatase D family protein [Bryobacteraceae bacterium]